MRLRWRIFLSGCGTLFLLGFSLLGFDLYRLFYQPMKLNNNSESMIVRVDKATTAAAFVRTLHIQHLIKSKRLFLNLIRAQGLSQQLKAGIYQVGMNESAQQFLYRVVAGDVLTESFLIIEGSTQKQIAARLMKAAFLTYHADDWNSLFQCLNSLGKTPSQPLMTSRDNSEGLLLADTYQYAAGSDSKDLMNRANAALIAYIHYQWQQRSSGLPYRSPYELLIAASILEKETAIPNERRIISGVIVNRLKKYMPLQMDPTVIYALGDQYQGKLSHADLQLDSPYNTYRHRGLPPTPIAMVGKDAIEAAAHPQQTDYLYYVAKGDGSHYFSATYDQQRQAIDHYLGKNSHDVK
jgi:UPF0755 protein